MIPIARHSLFDSEYYRLQLIIIMELNDYIDPFNFTLKAFS